MHQVMPFALEFSALQHSVISESSGWCAQAARQRGMPAGGSPINKQWQARVWRQFREAQSRERREALQQAPGPNQVWPALRWCCLAYLPCIRKVQDAAQACRRSCHEHSCISLGQALPAQAELGDDLQVLLGKHVEATIAAEIAAVQVQPACTAASCGGELSTANQP